jgi:hypothetical protein
VGGKAGDRRMSAKTQSGQLASSRMTGLVPNEALN